MKKIMSVMLGLSLVVGVASLAFGLPPEDGKTTKKPKKKNKPATKTSGKDDQKQKG